MSVVLRLSNCKIMVFELKPKTGDELHGHHHEYQISAPLIGTGEFQHNNTIRHLAPGSTLLLNPTSKHRHVALTEPTRILLIAMDTNLIQTLLIQHAGKSVGSFEFSPWGTDASSHFVQMAHQALTREVIDPMNQLEIQEFETKMVELLLTYHVGTHSEYWKPTVPPINHSALRLCVEFIHENLTSDLSLEELSVVSSVSKYHLIRLFQAMLGSTPSSYIRELRLSRAKHLLVSTSKPVTWIAFESGFNSLASFERAFRRHFGVPPLHYRASAT